jgi:hypothetical protein
MATERPKRRLETSPADSAVLKEVGLTSDEESGNAWGSSGEEGGLQQDVNEEQGPQGQSLGEALACTVVMTSLQCRLHQPNAELAKLQ